MDNIDWLLEAFLFMIAANFGAAVAGGLRGAKWSIAVTAAVPVICVICLAGLALARGHAELQDLVRGFGIGLFIFAHAYFMTWLLPAVAAAFAGLAVRLTGALLWERASAKSNPEFSSRHPHITGR